MKLLIKGGGLIAHLPSSAPSGLWWNCNILTLKTPENVYSYFNNPPADKTDGGFRDLGSGLAGPDEPLRQTAAKL